MKTEIKKNWVDALRSGKYPQGKFKLCRKNESERSEDSFCCLGVLCETLGIEKDSIFNSKGWEYYIYNFPDSTTSTSLPHSFANDIGLSEDNLNTLIWNNDYGNKSFAEIADWIEKNLEVTE